MEHAKAMDAAIPAFKSGQPLGDGIGPMVVGKMMLDVEKEIISFQTALAKVEYENRTLFLLKAEGPGSTVGRPDEALQKIIDTNKIDVIIMVDAALKMEGEDSASIARGFGAAIGGIGTEKFQIEAIATTNQIPVFSIIVKQSVKEAITLMSKDIADQADNVRSQVYEMIYPSIYMITLQGSLIYLLSIGDLSANIPQFWAGVIIAFLAYALSAKAVMRGSFFSTKTILLFALVDQCIDCIISRYITIDILPLLL